MHFRTLVLLLLTASIPLHTHAQNTGARTLSLTEAVVTALERNQDLAAARLEVDKADARVREAWGYALPAIDVTGRYTRALKKPVFFLPDFSDLSSGRIVPIEIGTDHAFDFAVTARQALFNYTVITGVGAARIYSRAARDLYAAKELETIASVRKAFYGALLASEVRDLMHSNLRNAEENLRNVRLLSGQGIVSEYDELRAIVGVENLRPAVIQAENNHALAVDHLRALIGIGVDDRIEIDGTLAFIPVDDDILSSAVNAVTERNRMLKSLRQQVDVNKAFVTATQSDYLPSLAAFGNYQYQAARNQFRFSGNDFIGSSQVGIQ
ncbi:MAG: TolC family protein, partial [Bacteroidota bacterium]